MCWTGKLEPPRQFESVKAFELRLFYALDLSLNLFAIFIVVRNESGHNSIFQTSTFEFLQQSLSIFDAGNF